MNKTIQVLGTEEWHVLQGSLVLLIDLKIQGEDWWHSVSYMPEDGWPGFVQAVANLFA